MAERRRQRASTKSIRVRTWGEITGSHCRVRRLAVRELIGLWVLVSPLAFAQDLSGEVDDVESDEGVRFRRQLDGSEVAESRHSTLPEVWISIAFGFCWMVWLVSFYIHDDVERYEREGIHVWGHVLETQVVLIDDDSQSGPIYHALVDYTLEPDVFGGTERIHVRKSFQTSMLLERGFANVAVIVVRGDPRSGILKKEWQKKRQEKELEEKGQSEDQVIHPCLALLLTGAMVLLSIVGSVLHILRLPADRELYGWVSLVLGVTLMGPCALLIHKIAEVFNACAERPERRGIILSPPKQSFVDGYQSHETIEKERPEIPGTPKHSNQHLMTTTKDERNTSQTEATTLPIQQAHSSLDESSKSQQHGTYYVTVPEAALLKRHGRSAESSMSSISANTAENTLPYYQMDFAFDKLHSLSEAASVHATAYTGADAL